MRTDYIEDEVMRKLANYVPSGDEFSPNLMDPERWSTIRSNNYWTPKLNSGGNDLYTVNDGSTRVVYMAEAIIVTVDQNLFTETIRNAIPDFSDIIQDEADETYFHVIDQYGRIIAEIQRNPSWQTDMNGAIVLAQYSDPSKTRVLYTDSGIPIRPEYYYLWCLATYDGDIPPVVYQEEE